MQQEDRERLRELIDGQRQAALATLADGAPATSMVLYAVERRDGTTPAFLIHISRLAAHTGQLLANPRASLLIMQPDMGVDDPQALPRVSIQVTAEILPADSLDYDAARATYLARLPQQKYLFDFPDFMFVRLLPGNVRYVGGFAKAFSLNGRKLGEILSGRS